MRDFAGETYYKQLVACATILGASSNTSSVDMETCRNAKVIVDFAKSDDDFTTLNIQHSSDDSTFTTHTAIGAIAATENDSYDCSRLKRYVRLSWTRNGSGGSSTWCAYIVGDRALRSPVED